MKTNNQQGFAILIVILIIAVVSGVGGVGYLKVKSGQDTKTALAAQTESDKKIAAAKKLAAVKATEKAAKAEAETKAQAEAKAAAEKAQSTKAATPTVVPSPKATTPVSNAKAFTVADCNKPVTAYIMNKSGTTGSYTPPENWHAEKSLAYGAPVIGDCYYHSSMGGYVIINDLWLKITDLSSTKP